MDRINDIAATISGVFDVVRFHVPPERMPNGTIAGAVLGGVGFLLAFWGAKVLRVVVVLSFVAAGGMTGVQIARQQGVDALIGLLLGAGVVGLLGHFLYRWWVGFTAGMIALMLVAALSAPEIGSEVNGFLDQQHGVGTGGYDHVLPAPESEAGISALRQELFAFGDHLMAERRDVVYRLGAVGGLAFLVGLGLGLMLPRLTTVIGTSVLGVSGLLIGFGVLMSKHQPGAWSNVSAHPGWLAAAAGLICLTAVSVQARGRKRASPAEPDADGEPAFG